MNACQLNVPNPWLICEATTRWAAAIRTTMARDRRFGDQPPRLREFRGLADLTDALDAARESFLCIEVDQTSLAAVVCWLPAILAQYPHCHAAAGLAANERLSVPLHSLLAEAGFLCVAESPRAVNEMIDLGQKHDLLEVARKRLAMERRTETEQVWSRLPWQAGGPPLG